MQVSSLDPVERSKEMLHLIRNYNQASVWDVIKGIGEAEEKRGERMVEYLNLAKDFYKEMQNGE